MESVHDLFTDPAGFGFHVGVALHQSSKSVMFRSFLLDLRLVDRLFIFLLLLLRFFAGCDLESILNLLFETFLKSIDDFVYMQFYFRFLKLVLFVVG